MLLCMQDVSFCSIYFIESFGGMEGVGLLILRGKTEGKNPYAAPQLQGIGSEVALSLNLFNLQI